MYFKPRYDTDTSEIEKFNDTLSIKKINILIKNVHKSWCDHLTEIKQSTYDATYDLSNYTKISTQKKNCLPTSLNGSFHARFSGLSALITPIKLRIYNCSHRHHCESVVYSGSMIDIVIPKKIFHCFT